MCICGTAVLLLGEAYEDRESNGLDCAISEPGAVGAWRDSVHEQGTREYEAALEKWIGSALSTASMNSRKQKLPIK
ncbi:hypothetical protein [Paenibacillus donghaensis]|uniref:Uncharacterized protein n=1 Tax=Paenibacillus donghaensis TaxID=414771 RepID=A0A2Z2KA78_9BACL|nr:hypothetical protein [Paenibacillus donghaensis]ASA23596.1 hypothetical protein B9T62_24065 [Paenibacillus donghaensis]